MFERLVINLMVAGGTLGLTWGPVVYLANALQGSMLGIPA